MARLPLNFFAAHQQSFWAEKHIGRNRRQVVFSFQLATFLAAAMHQSAAAFHSPVPFLKESRRCRATSSLARPRMSAAKIHIGDVSTRLGAAVLATSDAAITARGRFTVAISGGSLPKLLAAGLAESSPPLDKWTVFLADERIVPLDHEDSNYRSIAEKIPGIEVVKIDPDLDAAACAIDYQERLVNALGESPVFDALLLGLGPDGHTCSLFPGHDLLNENGLLVAPITDSPKPPLSRVTLTLPVLNAARAAMFVCTGAGKAPVVKDILENPASALPGALVKPTMGELTWFLDEAAAGDLSKATAK